MSAHTRKDPYKSDEFWVALAEEKLAEPLISSAYRKRLELIWLEAKTGIGKTGVTSLHYPNSRK